MFAALICTRLYSFALVCARLHSFELVENLPKTEIHIFSLIYQEKDYQIKIILKMLTNFDMGRKKLLFKKQYNIGSMM